MASIGFTIILPPLFSSSTSHQIERAEVLQEASEF